MDSDCPAARRHLFDSLPDALASSREARYRGGRFTLKLSSAFSREEARVFRDLYEILLDLNTLASPARGLGRNQLDAACSFARKSNFMQIAHEIEGMHKNLDTMRGNAITIVFYEIVSGPFRSIRASIELLREWEPTPEIVQTLFYLSRDHLKIMRSVLLDLDPERRARDATQRLHSIDLLLEKWENARYQTPEGALYVSMENEFRGFVAERCLEFAELDSFFYHLANNTLRFASEPHLYIHVTQRKGDNLLWTFGNPVSPQQAKAVQEAAAREGSLFNYGASTGGTGLGLAILGSCVAYAYGYENTQQAEAAGVFGHLVRDGCFLLWFHWPMIDLA